MGSIKREYPSLQDTTGSIWSYLRGYELRNFDSGNSTHAPTADQSFGELVNDELTRLTGLEPVTLGFEARHLGENRAVLACFTHFRRNSNNTVKIRANVSGVRVSAFTSQ